ncbi:urease accessory protein UreD [Rudaeicoccus suwonensis]|uniref:Urease accessory protein n=1 Tax=Rudaeicoccus suwonensis TaxID=657409 RepID=A0A561E7H1_9MICO|nr:urease accessory protein UreD [Rudaeicoccus suwonensis]TWE11566.1 urease accessory protein [Rudaeicoccus suwonensis]
MQPATATTSIVARLTTAGELRLDLGSGLLSPRVVRVDGATAEIALVATGATLIGGDEVQVAITVGSGIQLVLRDIAGTVAYHGRGRKSFWHNSVQIEDDGILSWDAKPLVVSDGADVERSLVAHVATGGRLLLRDTVALGRTGELGGDLRCSTTVTYDDRPAIREDLHLDRPARGYPGVLGPHRVIDTLLAVGWQPQDLQPTDFVLARPGALARVLTEVAHESDLDQRWRSWSQELRGRP